MYWLKKVCPFFQAPKAVAQQFKLGVPAASKVDAVAPSNAAYHIGIRRNNCPASSDRPGIVLLCVQKIQQDGSMEDGEVLEAQALKDYNRGRAYLSDFANRDQVPVFEKINEAVECVVQKCKTERQKVQLLK